MKKFKENWEIQKNWQLLFPVLGIIGLGYSSFKLSNLFTKESHFLIAILITVIIFSLLLKFSLFLFKKLENKWAVEYRWEIIRIFIVFAITGTTASYIGKPILNYLRITSESFSSFGYWSLRILILFIMYQVLLVLIGWLLGQHEFFWNFEKKMLRRIGLKRFVD